MQVVLKKYSVIYSYTVHKSMFALFANFYLLTNFYEQKDNVSYL